MSTRTTLCKTTLGKGLLCLLCLIAGMVHAATVKPGITLISDNEAVYLGDSVILEVEAVGLVEPLDVSSLFKDADLLRETTGTRIAVIDERVVEVKLRRMEFVPRREGRAFFGPLNGITSQGAVNSNTVIINVLPPADTDWQPDEDDLQVTMQLTLDNNQIITESASADINTPYVGQHMVADIILKHRYPITEESLTLPSFHGFDVLSEFEERRTVEGQDTDNRWRVISWRYHLFAQHSGALTIDGIQWTGSAIRSRTQRAAFDRKTPDQQIQIKAAASVSDWWLPATGVSLVDDWSKDPRELSAGDEILRTITLTANGVLASHLPDVVPLESRALSTTLIKQTRTEQLTGNSPEATATFTFRMVAQSPIPVFLDTVRVVWHDTTRDTAEEAIIPARRINVGLPDRADLLADIALNDHWWSAVMLKLRGSGANFPYWAITLFVLSLFASLLWLREWRAKRAIGQLTRSGLAARVLPEL